MGRKERRPGEEDGSQGLPRGEAGFQKRTARLLANVPEGFTIVTEDESIFVQDIKVRRVWAGHGIRPVRIVSGSHFRTAVFGAMSIDGVQLFRQYYTFDGPSFLDFLKKVHRKFGSQYLFLDKARQHRRTKIVTDYLKHNRKRLRVRWIPTASPEFDMMEECWRQGEKDLSA